MIEYLEKMCPCILTGLQYKAVTEATLEWENHYRELFDKHGIKPGKIKDFSDYRKIPYINKFIVNDHRSELTADTFSKDKLVYASTGGSTAIQVGFYREKGRSQEIEKAFVYRRQVWAGYNPENLSISLETSALGLSPEEEKENSESQNGKQSDDKYYWYNALENRLLFSYRNLSEKTLSIAEESGRRCES